MLNLSIQVLCETDCLGKIRVQLTDIAKVSCQAVNGEITAIQNKAHFT